MPVFDASPVQAMSRDADGVMQIVELIGVEPDRLLRTPTETLSPCRQAQRDATHTAVFENDFDLLVFAT